VRISDIHVHGFGVWSDVYVDALPPGITLFYGPNEAGKTTLMQFVRAVLYGFSSERRKLYLPPVYGGAAGGIMHVQNHSGEFTIERRLDEEDEDRQGRAIVLSASGGRQGQHLLNMLVSGIDEAIFNNVFAVGIRELQELATLNDTQAAEQLYNLASGVDRVSLVEVMQRLEADRAAIWSGKEDAELSRLTTERERLQRQIGDLQQQTRHWADLTTQQRSLIAEIGDLEERIERTEVEARTVEIAIQVRESWQTRIQLLRQRKQIGHLEPLPADCLTQLEQLQQEIAQQRQVLQPLKKRRHEIRQELAVQPLNQKLWDHSCRIEAMCEHAPWMASLDEEIRRHRGQIEAAELELLKYDEEFLARGGVSLANAPTVSPRVAQQLQGPAQALRESVKKRALARKLHKSSRQAVDQVSEELTDTLPVRHIENFPEALEEAAQLVKRLRRRVDVDERLTAMWHQHDELQQTHGRKLDGQLQRVRVFAAIGLIFVFGCVLILTGAFGWNILPIEPEVGWSLAFLGLICVALSAAWKMVLERTNQDELQAIERQIETLEDEIDQSVVQRDELDRELPTGGGTFSTRLDAAEKQLKELESLAPAHQVRQEASKRQEVAKRRASGVDEELREARSRWRRALRTVGLPESLAPKHVRQLHAHHQKKAKVEARLAEHRQRLEQIEKDHHALIDRLLQLNQTVGLNTVSQDPQIQLSQLANALSGQRDMVDRRRELQREEKTVRREIAQLVQKLRKATRARDAIFSETHVQDEQELHDRQSRLEQASLLDLQIEQLSEQITFAVGGHCAESEIERELTQFRADELEERWNRLLTRLQESQTHLKQLHERRGEVNQERKSLCEDRGLAATRFQLACLEHQIETVTCRWRASAVTSAMLECIRESYEAERQPETLGEASLYLDQLTGGKYVRIWTPLGKNELRIDHRDGKALSIDVLSRGTREAVFLSLRLALVAAYGRRGVTIPMILDDVLVNLDLKRARNAVDVLCQFAAEGRQLLFFTCHDHIQQMFLDARVDVRVLPAHGKPGIHIPSYIPPAKVEPEPVAVTPAIALPEAEPEPELGEVSEPTFTTEPFVLPLSDNSDDDAEYELADVDGEQPPFDLTPLLAEADEAIRTAQVEYAEEEELETEAWTEDESESDEQESEVVSEVDEHREAFAAFFQEGVEESWWWEPAKQRTVERESAA
jgi:uncharacterized protein YhaN